MQQQQPFQMGISNDPFSMQPQSGFDNNSFNNNQSAKAMSLQGDYERKMAERAAIDKATGQPPPRQDGGGNSRNSGGVSGGINMQYNPNQMSYNVNLPTYQ